MTRSGHCKERQRRSNLKGDGDTSPDAVLQGSSVLLRAERSGQGNERVYAITEGLYDKGEHRRREDR